MATTAGTKRAQPFAHLLGGLMGRVTGAKADDGPDEPKKENQDDEKNLEGDDDASAKGAKAEGDDDDEKKGPDDAGADDGDDDDDKKKDDDEEPAGKKARKAKADDDGGDEESAKRADAAFRAGRKAERARCRAIFNSHAAGVRPDIAANLAFNTGLSSANAIAMLETTVQGTAAFTTVSARSGLGERMANHPIPNVGAGNGGGAPNLVQQIVAANNKRLGIEAKK